MDITEGFTPGSLGEIVTLHSKFYAAHWGFGIFFEAKVAREIAEFADRARKDDLILIASDNDGVAASLILDLHDPMSGERGAHLCAGSSPPIGAGAPASVGLSWRALLPIQRSSAQGRMWLTTFAGLKPARHLYEDFGFKLASEAEGEAWGTRVLEQEFRR